MSFTPRPVSFAKTDRPSSMISSAKAQLGRVFSRLTSGSTPSREEKDDAGGATRSNLALTARGQKTPAAAKTSPPDFAVASRRDQGRRRDANDEGGGGRERRRSSSRMRTKSERKVATAGEEEEEEEEEEDKEEDKEEERRDTRHTRTKTISTKKRSAAHEYTDEEISEMEAIVRKAKRRKMGERELGEAIQWDEASKEQQQQQQQKRYEEAKKEKEEEEDDESPYGNVRDILHTYRQKRLAKKTRYAHRPRGLAATAGATSYGLLRLKVSKASEKKSLLRPTEIGTSGNVNGNTSPAKLAPPFRGAGSPTVPTSHNVLKKRDPRIVSTPGPVSIGFPHGERSKKRTRVGEEEFMPPSVMNRNVSRKLGSSSTPLQQQGQQLQTPKVDLSAVRAAKEKMATQTASKILRALDKANEFRSGGATPGRKPSFTPAATTAGQPSSRLRSSNQKGLNVSFADDARTPSPAADHVGTAPASHRMSTPYPTRSSAKASENEFNNVQGCDQSVLTDEHYERLQRKYGHGVQESYEFNEERYVPESIDEDDEEVDASGEKQEDDSDSESDDAPIGFKMGPGTAQKEKKSASHSFGTKTTPTMTKTKEDKIQEDKKEEGDSAKTPVVNLWSAEFMAKNKAHQAKVQKAIEEEEGGGGAAGAPGKAAPNPFAPTTKAAAPSPFTFGTHGKKPVDDTVSEKKPAGTAGGFSFGIPSTTAAPVPTTSKSNPFLASVQKKENATKTDDTLKQPTFHFRAPDGTSIGSGAEVKPSTAKFTFAGSTPSAVAPSAATITTTTTTTTTTEPAKASAPLFSTVSPATAVGTPKPAAAPTFTFGTSAPSPVVASPSAASEGEKSGLLGFLASTKSKKDETKDDANKDEPAKPPPATFSFGGGLATAPKADAKPPAFTGFGAVAKLPTPIETTKKEDGETKLSSFGTSKATPAPASSSPFVFGAVKPTTTVEAPSPAKPAETAKPTTFTFGAAKPAEDAVKPAETAKPATFTFGAAPAATAPTIAPTSGLFGATVAKPNVVTPPVSSTPASSTSFTFGASAPSAATVEEKQAAAKAAAPFTFGSTAAPSSAPAFTFNAGNGGGGGASAPNPFAPSTGNTTTNPSPFGSSNAVSPFSTSAPTSGGANPFGGGGGGGGGGGANPFNAPAGANPFANNTGSLPQQQQSGSFGAPSNSDSSQVVPGGRKPIRRAKRPTRR